MADMEYCAYCRTWYLVQYFGKHFDHDEKDEPTEPCKHCGKEFTEGHWWGSCKHTLCPKPCEEQQTETHQNNFLSDLKQQKVKKLQIKNNN